MRKKILIGVGVIAAILCIAVAYVAMQPSEYKIVRSTTISAPPAAVFAQVNDFHNWQAWSPWLKLDPAAKAEFEGPSEGEGAVFKWSGNDDVGQGRMAVRDSRAPELVRIDLEFIRPFPDECVTEFSFKPEGAGTQVTWSMTGRKDNLMAKAMCLVMNMDKMVGTQFQEGLANMKAIVEAKKN